MCPDLISRYLSNVMTIDQIETLINKTMDGDLNTFQDIPHTALKQITDKAKLPNDVIYAGTPYTQSILHHTDIAVDGLMNEQILQWNSSLSKWVNVSADFGGGEGDITGAANLSGTGATIFASEVTGILNFNRIRSMSTALSIANSGNEIQLTTVDGTTSVKGVLQLCTSGEASSSKAVMGTDSRLSNDRVPLAHKTSHQLGGADAIKLDDLAAPDDVTDLDASTVKHGLMMRYPNNTTQFLRADGTWQPPPTPSVGVTVLTKEVEELYISSDSSERTLISYTVAGGSLGTSGVLRITIGGQYLNDTSSSEYLGIRIKIDNTVLWGEEVGSITNQPRARGYFLQAILNQANSTSVQKVTGSQFVSDDIAPSIAGDGGQDDDEGCYDLSLRGTSSIDWSTDHTVSVTAELSSSSSNHTFTRDIAIIELL